MKGGIVEFKWRRIDELLQTGFQDKAKLQPLSIGHSIVERYDFWPAVSYDPGQLVRHHEQRDRYRLCPLKRP